MLKIHKPKCENNEIATIRTSPDSHFYRKNQFHKNPIYFRIYADFDTDNEKDNSSVGNKTTSISKRNPLLEGYHIETELEDVLQSNYNKSPLGYNRG